MASDHSPPSSAPRRAIPARKLPARHRRRLAIFARVATVLALIATSVVFFVSPARAATTTLYVNSTAWGGADANPGNGVCETAAGNGVCTLRAAIQESNALNQPAGAVLITVATTIAYNTKMTGSPNTKTDFMLTTGINIQDTNGAQYHVTAPVIIDLAHRLQPDSGADDSIENAVFYLNGSDIQILNADYVLSSGSSFVIGPNAVNVTIDGDTVNGGFGKIATTAGWGPERFVVVMQGAQNVTVVNYQITGYYRNNNTGGLFVFANSSGAVPATPTRNVLFNNIQVLNNLSGGCGGSDGSGCNTRVVTFWSGANDGGNNDSFANNVIENLTFTNMIIQNMTSANGQWGFMFADQVTAASTRSSDITNLVIENNRFLNNALNGTTPQNAFIMLPFGNYLRGTNSISNNVFTSDHATGNQTGQGTAIFFLGSQGSGSTHASNLTIANNYFNGYGGSGTIRVAQNGLTTVTGNTFGRASIGIAGSGEETNGTGVMFSNSPATTPYTSSNQAILTWAPTTGSATVLTTAPSASALPVSGGNTGGLPTCAATVTITKPTSAVSNTTIPADPVTLEVYWTTTQTAEVYLGKVTGVVGPNATLTLAVPVGTLSLPDGSSTATPVNPTTGAASGFVRVQTHVEGLTQLESSQYSRAVSLTGNCRPALTINQAAGMSDPTSGRDLHFTLASSIPLDTSVIPLGIIQTTATAVPQTIDAGRLNPQVISVTAVPGSSDTVFDVVVRVDDSAKVTVAVAAGTVTATSGLTNAAAASSTDNSITFLNPIQVDPSTFTIVTGEPNGKSFVITLAAGAPVPASDLSFSATVDQPAGTPQVIMSTQYPTIDAGSTTSAPVTVTAAPGDVTANTKTTIALTMASTDPNYNGLVIPTVTPYLFSTDPTIRITKTAYVNVADTSTPARIEATGTPAPRDSRLLDGQAICFVYTVTNTSADDWATTLSNVAVTDSDTRLGKNGLIGTIPTIVMGDAAKLAACTTLIPVDTETTKTTAGVP